MFPSTLSSALSLEMPEFKRPADVALVPAKKSRQEGSRSSDLQSEIVLLQGHEGEIYGAKFSPDGTCLASVGFDMRVFLWNVFGESENFSCFRGHTGAIMEVQFFTDSSLLLTASTDKTLRVWDMETGVCARKFRGHGNFVNSCHPARRGPQLVCSGSDDGTVKVWDTRKRDAVITLQNTYQLTAVSFNDTSEQVISGSIDNDIKNLLRCCWSPDSQRISCGSSDRFVYIWDVVSQRILYKLPGHQGSVNDIHFHPFQPIVLSAGSDKRIYLGEIE